MNNYNVYHIGEDLQGKHTLSEGAELKFVGSYEGFEFEDCVEQIQEDIEDNIQELYSSYIDSVNISDYQSRRHNKILCQALRCYKDGDITPKVAIKQTFGMDQEPAYLVSATLDRKERIVVYYVIMENTSSKKVKPISFSVSGEEYLLAKSNKDGLQYTILTLEDESRLVVEQNKYGMFTVIYDEKGTEETKELRDDVKSTEELEGFIEDFLDKNEHYIEF